MTNETCTRERKGHYKSELEEGEVETNESCPAEQEWYNKLLMEIERWGKEEERERGNEQKERPMRAA